jgi:hypothetical protein
MRTKVAGTLALVFCWGCTEARQADRDAGRTKQAAVTHKPALAVVVDANGAAVPCATISSWEGDYTYVTDASGIAAFYEPELMGRSTGMWVTVQGPDPENPGGTKPVRFGWTIRFKEAVGLASAMLSRSSSPSTRPRISRCQA